MLEVVVGSFFRVLKKPGLIFPGIFLTLSQVAIWSLFFYLNDALPRFFYELFVLNIFPNAGFFETIFLLVVANPVEFLVLGFFAVLWIAATQWMIFALALSVEKNEPPLKSVFGSLNHAGKILGLAVFYGIVLLLFAVVMLFFIWLFILGGIIGSIGLIATVLWLFVGAFIYFKLLVLPVEFFLRDEKITVALKKSWNWSNRRLISTVVFTFLALLVSNIILSAGVLVSDIVAIDAVSILAVFLAMSFGSAYFGVALVAYYLSQNSHN